MKRSALKITACHQAALKASTTSVLENEIANVTCLENKIGMKIVSAGSKGVSVAARVSEFSFAQCTVPNGKGGTENCTVKPVNMGPTEAEQWGATFAGSGGNGNFQILFSSLGGFGFFVVCNEKVERIVCTFESATNSTFTGGAPATIAGAEKMMPSPSGKKCPKTQRPGNSPGR